MVLPVLLFVDESSLVLYNRQPPFHVRTSLVHFVVVVLMHIFSPQLLEGLHILAGHKTCDHPSDDQIYLKDRISHRKCQNDVLVQRSFYHTDLLLPYIHQDHMVVGSVRYEDHKAILAVLPHVRLVPDVLQMDDEVNRAYMLQLLFFLIRHPLVRCASFQEVVAVAAVIRSDGCMQNDQMV